MVVSARFAAQTMHAKMHTLTVMPLLATARGKAHTRSGWLITGGRQLRGNRDRFPRRAGRRYESAASGCAFLSAISN